MQNLVSLQRRVWTLEACSTYENQCVAFASAPGDAHMFFLSSCGRIYSLHLDEHDVHSHGKKLQSVFNLQETVEDSDASAGCWQWMSYVDELGALVCASTSGALVSVDVDTMSGDEVGSVDSGLRAVAWSANQEVLALVTGNHALLVMSNDWEVLHETAVEDFLPSELKLSSARRDVKEWCCSLCWRSDSAFVALNLATRRRNQDDTSVVHKVLVFTQLLEFHALGRLEDGRAIAGLGSALDWSQSLALIASSEVRKGQLVVVFFERNGLRHGEFVIPAPYCAPAYEIAHMQWNATSEVLAVTLQGSERRANVEQPVRIQLWSRSNYHWYLKQELQLSNQLVALAWDEDVAGRLNVLTYSLLTQTLKLYEHEFAWDICSIETEHALVEPMTLEMQAEKSGVAVPRQSVAVTGVIDGSKLLLTPLHRTLVPPPFALLQVTLNGAINSIVFDSQAKVVLVLLAGGDVVMVENYLTADARASSAGLPAPPNTAARSDVLMKETRIKFSHTMEDGPLEFSSLLWAHFDATTRRLVFAGKTGWRDQLVLCLTNTCGRNDDEAVTVYRIELFDVRRACLTQRIHSEDDQENSDEESMELAIQTHCGAMYTLNALAKEEVVPTRGCTKLPAFSHMTVLDCHDQSMPRAGAEDGFVVIGLEGSSARLYVNGQVLALACSSFRYSALFSMLFFTTQGREPQLCIASKANVQDFAFGNGTVVKYEARAIERGALLVATLSQRSSIIVQMPRGNLECMYPRVLVLALAVQQLQAREYVAALETCRRHRLDLNLLVDFDPFVFLDSFSRFLVHSLLSTRPATVTSDRLCLFITTLHPIDVWATKYGSLLEPFDLIKRKDKDDQTRTSLNGEEKVNTICQKILRVTQELASAGEEAEAALLLPFVTSAVKQSPPRFDEALGKIQQLLQPNQGEEETTLARNRAAATRAIKHLIMLTNVDTLYAEAMGRYDLNLVRIVAMHSQRDPKEYGPFLDRVASLANERWRKYTIDVHLGRHAQALTHVAALISETDADDLAEISKLQSIALDLIKQGGLYDEALRFFPLVPMKHGSLPSDRAFCHQILSLKGEYLLAKKEYAAAAYVYLSASEKEKARRAFIAARDWQMALALSDRDPESADKVRDEAYALAQELLNQEQDRQDGAVENILVVSRLYVEYCHDIDEAVALLVAHQQWSEALRLAYLHKREDLVTSDVEPGVVQSCDDVMDELEHKEVQFVKHFQRWTTICEQKRLFKLHGIDGRRWDEDDTEAGSIRSGASSAVESALSYASVTSVGSHNSAASIDNFSMQSLSMATASHFYATQTLGDAASKKPRMNAKHKGNASRRERRKRIKEGSAEEEAYVSQQLSELRPNAALLHEVQRLLQMLVFFGHVQQAQKLQSQLARFEQCVADCKVPAPSASPGKTVDACDVEMPQWRLEALLD